MNRLRQGWYALLMVLAGPLAQAHIASNGFVTLKVVGGEVSGAVELAIRDGELAVGLDRDGDGRVTWRELRSSQTALQNYVMGHLGLQGDDAPCRMGFGPVQVNERVDGSYLWLPISADCGPKRQPRRRGGPGRRDHRGRVPQARPGAPAGRRAGRRAPATAEGRTPG